MLHRSRFLGSCSKCLRREIVVVPIMSWNSKNPSIHDCPPKSMDRAGAYLLMPTFQVAFPFRTAVQSLCKRLQIRTRRPWSLACNHCLALEYLANLSFDGRTRRWDGSDLWGRELTRGIRRARSRKHPEPAIEELRPKLDRYILDELRDYQRRYRVRRRIPRSPFAERHICRALAANDLGDWTKVIVHCNSALRLLKQRDPDRSLAHGLLRRAKKNI